MANIKVDTTSLKEAGYDLVNLSVEYKEIVSTIFEKINAYDQTGTWKGRAAQNYIGLINTEKSNYETVGNIMNEYGNTLIKCAENYEEFAFKSDLE